MTFKRTFLLKKLNGTSSWNSNFNLCDQLSTEVLSFDKKRREIEAALQVLKSKQKNQSTFLRGQKGVNSFDLELAPTEGDSNFLSLMLPVLVLQEAKLN